MVVFFLFGMVVKELFVVLYYVRLLVGSLISGVDFMDLVMSIVWG